MQRDAARRVLGIPVGAAPADVERAFRRLALDLHPDRGGEAEEFRTLLVARAALRSGEALPGHQPHVTRTRVVVRHTGARWALRRIRSRFPFPTHSTTPPRVR